MAKVMTIHFYIFFDSKRLTSGLVLSHYPLDKHYIYSTAKETRKIVTLKLIKTKIQSNFNGSNTFGIMKICSRQG